MVCDRCRRRVYAVRHGEHPAFLVASFTGTVECVGFEDESREIPRTKTCFCGAKIRCKSITRDFMRHMAKH
jgi:hypothetical protein